MNNSLIINELLFYIQNRIRSATKEKIVKACSAFYELPDIYTAISTLESALKICLSKRNTSDDLKVKLVTDLYDKIWSLDASATSLPTFVAADIEQVPQDRKDSADTDPLASVEQLLSSINTLKSAVKQLQTTMITREFFDRSIAEFKTITALAPSVSSSTASFETSSTTPFAMPSETSSLAPSVMPSAAPSAESSAASSAAPSAASSMVSPAMLLATPAADISEEMRVPDSPLPIFSQTQPIVPPESLGATAALFSSVANPSLTKKQNLEIVQRQKGKTNVAKKKPTMRNAHSSLVIGKNVSVGLTSFRGADLTTARYIGKLDVGVDADAVREFLNGNDVDVVSVEKIKTSHNKFSSFKLVIKKSQLPKIQDAALWPEGVVVGRFWLPKSSSASVDSAQSLNENG